MEALGLSTAAKNRLTAKLQAVAKRPEAELLQDAGVTSMLEAFIVELNHWSDLGEITVEERDRLRADAQFILGAMSLLSEPANVPDDPILEVPPPPQEH